MPYLCLLFCALGAPPDDLVRQRELVKAYANAGRDAAAIRLAKQLLATDPHDAETAHRLGLLLFGVKRYAEAGDAFRAGLEAKTIANSPSKALAMQKLLARSRELANDTAAAEKAWRELRNSLESQHTALLKDGISRAELERETADAAERHGHALLKNKQFDAAAQAFHVARDLFANEKTVHDRAAVARLEWNLCELYTAKKEPKSALIHLEKYLATRPRELMAYERYAGLLRQTQPNEVMPKLRAMADVRPANWLLQLELLRSPTTFATAHAELLELLPTTREASYFHVLISTYTANNGTAGLLEIIEAIYPPPPEMAPRKLKEVEAGDAARRLAFAEAFVANPEAALKVAGAARVTPTTRRSPEFWELLSLGCARAGKPDDVEAALRAALNSALRTDGGFRAFQRLHSHLYSQRKWQEILNLCDETPFVGAGVLNFYRSTAYAELGAEFPAMRAVGLAEADNAFASRRQKIHILDILGKHAQMLKECDAAMAEFQTPSEISAIRYLRSQALLGSNRNAEAEAELRGILEDEPDDVLALNNLGYNLAEQNRKLDDAEQFIRRAIEIDSDARRKAGEPTVEHAAYIDSLGWVLFRKGKLKESREQLEKAVALPDGTTDPTVWDHLGDVAFRMGDTKRARQAWANAVKQYTTTHMGRQMDRLEEAKRKWKWTE